MAEDTNNCDIHGEYDDERCPGCLKDEKRHLKEEEKRIKAQRREEALVLKALEERELRVRCHHCGHEQDHVGVGSPVCDNKECVTRDDRNPLHGSQAFQEIE